MKPLEKAIQCCEGQAGLASAIGGEVKQQHVWNWLNRSEGKVPAEHCPAIEFATRRIATERCDESLVVTCEELRPDVKWDVVRDNAAPEPATTEQG